MEIVAPEYVGSAPTVRPETDETPVRQSVGYLGLYILISYSTIMIRVAKSTRRWLAKGVASLYENGRAITRILTAKSNVVSMKLNKFPASTLLYRVDSSYWYLRIEAVCETMKREAFLFSA
jgi:hypothetical protein